MKDDNKPVPMWSFTQLALEYCRRQESTPEQLLSIFKSQRAMWGCSGWFLLECQDMSSSYMGSLTILPFGCKNTFKDIPAGLVSPRGLASDQSLAIAYTLVEDLPEELPKELLNWEPPVTSVVTKPKRKRKK